MILLLAAVLQGIGTAARHEPVITTVIMGRNQIGLINTAPAISTKLSFPEQIKEVICGDLYDPATGRGSFVVQKSENDLFLKPVTSKGVSNLFVKTGENGEYVYSFDLLIVSPSQAHRIVNVVNGQPRPVAAKKAAYASSPMQTPPPLIEPIKIGDADVATITGQGSEPPRVDVAALQFSRPPTGPDAKAPPRAKVIGSIDATPRRATNRIKPLYPELAWRAGISGPVIVEATIDQKGKVTVAKAVSGPQMLRGSAVLAARSWRFAASGSPDKNSLDTIRITFRFLIANREIKDHLSGSGGQPD
jgi:TonB family protein